MLKIRSNKGAGDSREQALCKLNFLKVMEFQELVLSEISSYTVYAMK